MNELAFDRLVLICLCVHPVTYMTEESLFGDALIYKCHMMKVSKAIRSYGHARPELKITSERVLPRLVIPLIISILKYNEV